MQLSKIDFVIHTTQTFFHASFESRKNLSFTRYAHLPHRQKKAPKPKHQIANNFKTTRDKIKTRYSKLRRVLLCRLPFAVCLLFDAWCLGFAS
jgi:hypothetical protein